VARTFFQPGVSLIPARSLLPEGGPVLNVLVDVSPRGLDVPAPSLVRSHMSIAPESLNSTAEPCHASYPDDIVELSVLLPAWQAAAHRRGLTVGQMVRRLIQRHSPRLPRPESA